MKSDLCDLFLCYMSCHLVGITSWDDNVSYRMLGLWGTTLSNKYKVLLL